MLEFLLETASKKKDKILKVLDSLEREKKTIKPPWKDVKIKELKGKKIAGEDGSYNYKELRSFTLYAIASQVFFFDGEMKSLRACDIDLLWPYKYTEDRLRFYMHIFESKISLKALKEFNPDLLLLDGSLIGMIIRPLPFLLSPPEEVRLEAKEKFLAKLEKLIENGGIEISSKKLWPEVKKEFFEFKNQVICYLEYLEHLIVLHKLLKEGKNKIVAIAKTSRATDYFDLGIPDMAIFERYSKKEGFSIPIRIRISKMLKRTFPILDKELREMDLTVFYARLEDKKNVLKFEIPGTIDEGQAIEILGSIKEVSTNGYPYLLKKAHAETIIHDTDIDHLIKIFGLVEKLGREML